jgi:hypothetical protein
MPVVLETAKLFWVVMKDGAKTAASGTTVSVLPQGMARRDLAGWAGPATYPQKYEALPFLFQSALADFTLTPNWEYNGQFIANFNVRVEGSVDVLASVDVVVATQEAGVDADDVVELPYCIDVAFRHRTGGTRRRTHRALARGDGCGRSVA